MLLLKFTILFISFILTPKAFSMLQVSFWNHRVENDSGSQEWFLCSLSPRGQLSGLVDDKPHVDGWVVLKQQPILQGDLTIYITTVSLFTWSIFMLEAKSLLLMLSLTRKTMAVQVWMSRSLLRLGDFVDWPNHWPWQCRSEWRGHKLLF